MSDYSANNRIQYHKTIGNNGLVWWHACILFSLSLLTHRCIYYVQQFAPNPVCAQCCNFNSNSFYTYSSSYQCSTVIICAYKIFYERFFFFQTKLKSNVVLLHSIFHFSFVLHLFLHFHTLFQLNKNCNTDHKIVRCKCKMCIQRKIIWWNRRVRAHLHKIDWRHTEEISINEKLWTMHIIFFFFINIIISFGLHDGMLH